LAGGIVRSTGSGMGCPDWPRCFGQWIPPTKLSELPINYQEIYGAKLKGEVVFNPTKTWIEYVNRLLGALTGLFVFGLVLTGFSFLKKDKIVFWLSFLSFLLIGFQGWLGSKVVSTELLPSMITLHMMLAILIILILLYVVSRSYTGIVEVETINNKKALNKLIVAVMIVSAIQIVLGTQVRQAIDEIVRKIGYDFRDNWISGIGVRFVVHRSFSWVVLILNLGLIYKLIKSTSPAGLLSKLSYALIAIVIVEILSGATMANFGVPAFIQPIHLTLAVIMIGVQFVVFLFMNASIVFPTTKEFKLK
jgi:cytochrome c oxidase assembly protein subunit 15